MTVKESWKLVCICWSYGQKSKCYVFWDVLYLAW